MGPKPAQLDVYRTAIPMRGFEHAAASRDLAEAVVVRLELSDGTVGWGETLPRRYVTGETMETVPRDVEELLWGPACSGEPRGRWLPTSDGDRPITAARCAVELAQYDASIRHGLRASRPRGRLGRFPPVRVSGVLGSSDPARTGKWLRLMRWYGLRDFKLKLGLGDDVDSENLRVVQKRIGGAIRKGKCTLRVDVNGGWSAGETPDRLDALKPYGVCAVEQPVFGPAEALAELARRCTLPLVADESVVTQSDAETFIRAAGGKVWLNLRLSKNGGIWPTLRIAEAAARAGVPFTIGCMVGESSILSAAQRELLRLCPTPRFVEGNYGRFLLADDLTGRSLRFGYGGRLRHRRTGAAGLVVDEGKLARYGRLVRTLRA